MTALVPEEPTNSYPASAAVAPSAKTTAGVPDPAVSMQVHRPSRDTVVVSVSGELDEMRTPRLDELLTSRLKAAVDTVVLDLSQVSFLGVEALSLLTRAHRHAQARGVALRLVTGPPTVQRALRAGGLDEHLETYASRSDAVAAASGAVTSQ